MQLSNIPEVRVERARSHYPVDSRYARTPPYRKVILTNPQTDQRQIVFRYRVTTVARFEHHNPPIWATPHPHDFTFTICCESPKSTADIYGCDMVETENNLIQWLKTLPKLVNDWPDCPLGTTEEMAVFVANRFEVLDPLAVIQQVEISETPNRTTIYEVPNIQNVSDSQWRSRLSNLRRACTTVIRRFASIRP